MMNKTHLNNMKMYPKKINVLTHIFSNIIRMQQRNKLYDSTDLLKHTPKKKKKWTKMRQNAIKNFNLRLKGNRLQKTCHDCTNRFISCILNEMKHWWKSREKKKRWAVIGLKHFFGWNFKMICFERKSYN